MEDDDPAEPGYHADGFGESAEEEGPADVFTPIVIGLKVEAKEREYGMIAGSHGDW